MRGRKISKTLPLELLVIIFKLAYQEVTTNEDGELLDLDDGPPIVLPEHLDRFTEHDLTSPSVFPYSLASVCSVWREAMSLVPKFWRRVVILTDPPATPLSAIVSQLTWSRDRDIEVIVTRRDLHATIKDPHERSVMVSIMDILRSHIHRIRELRFHAVFSSSLPSFPTDFHGTATMLEQLHLQCREDDGGPDCHEVVALTDREEFECPKLRSLVIDGRNYYKAYRRNARWTDKFPPIASLTISHFNPQPSESFSTYDFLRPLAAFGDPESIHFEVSSFVHHLDTANLVGTDRYRHFSRTLVDSLHT